MIEINLKNYPDSSGIYIMHDSDNKVIYVGKAKNIKKRITSYFNKNLQDPKTELLLKKIRKIEYILTDTEKEALLLEHELIKKYRPVYNVRLKDDKRYPYICLIHDEDFPRLIISRKKDMPNAKYFGPYPSTSTMNTAVSFIKTLYKIRVCKRKIPGNYKRACLEYSIGNCYGPCMGYIKREEYRENIHKSCLFLEGKFNKIIQELYGKIKIESERLNFEECNKLKQKIIHLEDLKQKQKIIFNNTKNEDYCALFKENKLFIIYILHIREGRVFGSSHFVFENLFLDEDESIFEKMILNYYENAGFIPSKIYLNKPINSADILIEYIYKKREKKVLFLIPQKGVKKELIEMSLKNAKDLSEKIISQKNNYSLISKNLKNIAECKNEPLWVIAIDISNISGKYPVGAVVSYREGKPVKAEYRLFHIKGIDTPDDYFMMKEVITRYFHYYQDNPPDLVLVDGGLGQLNTVLNVINDMNLKNITAISLAKKEELIFTNKKQCLKLEENNPVLNFLINMRNEVHRFAINFHRKTRQNNSLKSNIDEISGVGEKRKKILFSHFKTLENMKSATLEEITKVDKIPKDIALKIYNHFQK